uniref:Uncharacterized protein n=1 Tax=Cacopsylla melanoneura TaxID=428564 RepID=A0A8D8USB7_9HEMI
MLMTMRTGLELLIMPMRETIGGQTLCPSLTLIGSPDGRSTATTTSSPMMTVSPGRTALSCGAPTICPRPSLRLSPHHAPLPPTCGTIGIAPRRTFSFVRLPLLLTCKCRIARLPIVIAPLLCPMNNPAPS